MTIRATTRGLYGVAKPLARYKKTDDFMCHCQCGSVLYTQKVLTLRDNERFIDRSILISVCLKCSRVNIVRVQKDKNNNGVQAKHFIGARANRVLKREKSNIISLENFSKGDTCGLRYGINKEIRNKKGEVTQIRQYACDFNNKRDLIKKVLTK